jgi:site-specific DNA-methyltransferase (adenine-specific)
MPEPYYQDGSVTIYHGDCREVLPGLNDVGLVLTSPPYNLSGDGNKPSGTYFRNLGVGYGEHADNLTHAEYVAWQHEIVRACWTVLAADGAIFYNHKPRVKGNAVSLPLELIPPELDIRQIVVWDRGSGFNRKITYFVPAHEWVLLVARSDFRLATRSVDDVWRIPFEAATDHPAPFPLRLAKRAIASTHAQSVLDPFMGSGTTLRAAKDLGRKSIGIEIEERYCEMAAQRCAQEVLDLEAA